MKKVAFLCDSSADITNEEAQQLEIHVLRMPIIIDQEVFVEEETIFQKDIIQALNANKSVKTTQPSLGEMSSKWRELLKNYDEILYIPISNQLSGTCNNALQLAQTEEFANKVYVVNSRIVCYPIVHILKQAQELVQAGYRCEDVKKKIEEEAEMFAILIPENLQTLKNGGRISSAAAALAGLLKIYPLLKVENGAIDIYGKVRTITKAYKEGIYACTKDINPSDYDWLIIDANNRKVSDELKSLLEQEIGQPVHQKEFRSIIMSHTGVGTIGFGRIKKIK